MNKRLPFEDALKQQMNDLPSPDEDLSWQKMTQLLDKKEKRRPFAFFKIYHVLVASVFLILPVVWLMLRPVNDYKTKSVSILKSEIASDHKSATTSLSTAKQKIPSLKPAVPNSLPAPVNPKTISSTIASNKQTGINNNKLWPDSKSRKAFIAKSIIKEPQSQESFLQREDRTVSGKKAVANDMVTRILETGSHENVARPITVREKSSNQPDTVMHLQLGYAQMLLRIDTAAFTGVSKNKNIAAAGNNSTPHRGRYIITAGIGVQQQIPVAGQQIVHYGYNANNTITDYIPSVYFTFEKEQKWFLQGSFSYGTPQLVKEFAYSRQTVNSLASSYSTTTLQLNKTFYNQLPLSFNYYIRPQWSAGIGGMYSWFRGAITTKETLTNNLLTQSKSSVKEIVPIAAYTDSFLYKSHTYLLLQTDYHWRRFSAGIRYAKDMQPYIKYTLPDGTVTSQKNWSLEFTLKFRLWKSARF